IPKIDFFVFITLTGEYGTGIGINEETIVFRFITIKLRVWIRRKTLAGLVFNLIADIDQITIAAKSIRFDNRQALIRFPPQRYAQTLRIITQHIFRLLRGIGFIMRWRRTFSTQ